MAGLNRSLPIVLLLLVPATAVPSDLFDDLGIQRPNRDLLRRPPLSGERPGVSPGAHDPVNAAPSERDIRRAEAQKRARSEKLAQSWVPLGSTPAAVYAPSSTIATVPDTRFFGEPPAASDTFLAPLAKVGMAGSRIPSENLRRAAAIVSHLRTAPGPVSDEDAAFLASQAALALEGAPLQVVVDGSGSSGAAGRDLGIAIEVLGRQASEYEAARGVRTSALDEYRQIGLQAERGEIDPETVLTRKTAAAVRYADGARRERDAKKAVREATSGVVRVFVGGREVKP